jgi:hypothetical protein
MKRPGTYLFTRSKRPKLYPLYEPPKREYFWVTGTSVRNYVLRDPIIDWFNLSNKSVHSNMMFESKKETSLTFQNFILNHGKEFETSMVNYINNNIHDVVRVSDVITPATCRKVVEYMKQGIPIIHSAPVSNKKLHLRGVIDILIRSDYINKLTTDRVVSNELERTPCVIDNEERPYHYIVIDIKFSTLPLRADGRHLLNSNSFPAYKAQTWIYTQCIGKIQNYTSRYAFILGRRWTCTTKGEKLFCDESLDRLGTIDFQDVDISFIDTTEKAMDWLKDLKREGKTWTVNPPSRIELYPNMSADAGEWNPIKKEIAHHIDELTLLWYCGTKNREIAINKGVTKWSDPNCNANVLGMNGVRGQVVDKIIDINKQNRDKIRPRYINNNLFGWKDEDNEIFVDFETICDVFSPLDIVPDMIHTSMIIMIGVYYKSKSKFKYINFVAKNNTFEEEQVIMTDFVEFLEQLDWPKIWYWYAEADFWFKAEERQLKRLDIPNYKSPWGIDSEWADLHQIFRSEPIVIKDCFKYGLKEISAAMLKHKMIKAEMTSECNSGLDAAIKAWFVYKDSSESIKDPIFRDIENYNTYDVRVLKEILYYLRDNHVE